MKILSIEIPEELLYTIKIPRKIWKIEILKELAIQLYREELISFGNARRLAKMNKLDFIDLLGSRQISRQYDIDDFEEDLKTIQFIENSK